MTTETDTTRTDSLRLKSISEDNAEYVSAEFRQNFHTRVIITRADWRALGRPETLEVQISIPKAESE